LAGATPTFSVVIPAYNRAHLIRATIDSVLEQTFGDFEVLVVDDGSKDNTGEVVSAITDPRVRYVRQENAGANAARNRGIDEALGPFVAFLDSDDTFLPHHLEMAHQKLSQDPEQIIYSQVIVDRGGGKKFLKPPRAWRPTEHMAEYLMCDRGFVQTSTLVVPTNLARQVRYREGLPNGQDIDVAIRLFNAGGCFVMNDKPTAVWRDVADNSRISASSRPGPRLEWIEDMRAQVPARAYYGFRGWFIAKAFARQGEMSKALQLYFAALLRRAYSPKLSATIFLQLALSGPLYRHISNIYLKLRK